VRRSLIVVAAIAAAGCGGHTPPPSATSAPNAGPIAATSTASRTDPSSLRYAVGSGRYRVEESQHIRQEVMGQTTEIDGTSHMVVSAALTHGFAPDLGIGDALAAAFTVDSITATSTAPGASTVMESIRGKTFRAVFSPLGRSTSFTNPDSAGPMNTGGGDVFREFLAGLPAGTLAEGTSWTDTTTQTQSPGPGLTSHSQSIRQHRVVGWELHDGVRALRITTTGAYTITGSGEVQGQQMQINGTGVATMDQFVSAAGVYLGGAKADSANLMVNVLTMGMEVPIRQTRRVAVTRLP
jgi:hypothetical protein